MRIMTMAAALLLLAGGLAQAQTAAQPAAPGTAPVGPAPAAEPAPPPGATARPNPAPRAARARPRHPPGYQAARYRGGAGATWRTRDGHGFEGSFGGCRFRGVAGPGGYRLQRSC